MNSKAILCLLVILSSCKPGLIVEGSNKANRAFATKDIIKIHEEAFPNFETLAARLQVSYEDDKKSQSVTVSLRMEKDKHIWIKASLLGITLAKVLVTPQRVSYYETISNTYFDGDFTLLSRWLGTEIDFDKTQSILLGQSLFDLDPSNYQSTVIQNKYKLQPKSQPKNFIHSIFLYPNNFKVAGGTLEQPENNRLLTINYGEFQEIQGSFYPSQIEITAEENDRMTYYELKYRKIDLNVSIRFPFTIPEGYEEIQFD